MSIGGIEAPHSLASIPRPLDSESGQVWSAAVYSVSNSRKRKRHEAAVGVDGESVNIHNVQTGDLITSYAIPPQSYLAARPCSIYCRRHKPLRAQRRTYVALKDTLQGSNLRLICTVEELGGSHTASEGLKAPARTERRLNQGSLTSIEVIPPSTIDPTSDAVPLVLVSYQNGDVHCLSGDLLTQRWTYSADGQADSCVEFSAIVNSSSARKGLLKSRQDILATLDPSGINSLPLLCHVIRSDSKRCLRIFTLRNISENALQTSQNSLDTILTYELSSSAKQNLGHGEFELHAATGMLLQFSDQRLAVYDLSGMIAKVRIEIGGKLAARIVSFARLSSSSVIVTTSGGIFIYETRYGSLIASSPFQEDDALAKSDVRGNKTRKSSFRIVSYFSEIGLLAATNGTDLVAAQLGSNVQTDRRTQGQGASLVDVIGKGKNYKGTRTHTSGEKTKKRKFLGWTSTVDRLIDEGDIAGLEALLAKDLQLDQDEAAAPFPDGVELWPLPYHTYDAQGVNSKQINYILQKAFSWQPPTPGNLHGPPRLCVALRSRNILRWLARAGYMSTSQIALGIVPPANNLNSQPRLMPGDVMNAVWLIDKDFVTIRDLLTLPIHWDLAEVVQSLKLLIQSLDDRNLNGFAAPAQIGTTEEPISDIDAQIAAEMAAADIELAHASSFIETGSQLRSDTLKAIVTRLEAFAPKEVTTCMHTMLNHKEIDFFIRVLRIELANGGWTSQYVQGMEDENNEQFELGELNTTEFSQRFTPSDRSIRTISRLLSCAIDAIGISGWLIGGKNELHEAHDLIQCLANEVSAALSGCFEASRLDIMLREVAKTAGSAPTGKRKLEQGDVEVSLESSAMPLGARVHPPALPATVARGAKKSKVMAAQERRREIGKYSFERIRI